MDLMTMAKDIRVAVFGMGSGMNVVCVNPPKKIEDCGMYIHVEDIPKFLEWQKQMEASEGGVQRPGERP